jgi:hypothetical protein
MVLRLVQEHRHTPRFFKGELWLLGGGAGCDIPTLSPLNVMLCDIPRDSNVIPLSFVVTGDGS